MTYLSAHEAAKSKHSSTISRLAVAATDDELADEDGFLATVSEAVGFELVEIVRRWPLEESWRRPSDGTVYRQYAVDFGASADLLTFQAGVREGGCFDPDFHLRRRTVVVIRAFNDEHRDHLFEALSGYVHRRNEALTGWYESELPKLARAEISQRRARQKQRESDIAAGWSES